MNVYQVIKHEYDSDDGHYDHDPVDDLVYIREVDASEIRDVLNGKSVLAHNTCVVGVVAYRTELWEANGGTSGESPATRDRWGCAHYDWLSSRGIRNYAEKYLFEGDPTDVETLSRFADRDNALTYYTIETLRVFQ